MKYVRKVVRKVWQIKRWRMTKGVVLVVRTSGQERTL